MTDERKRIHAYFHYLNQTECHCNDPVSNWLEAQQQERGRVIAPRAGSKMPVSGTALVEQ